VGAQGTATVSFGATPTVEGSIAVTGQGAILATSLAEAWIMGAATATNTEQDHIQAGALIRCVCNIPTAGVGFTIFCDTIGGLITGDLKVQWVWN
jgi:hypothetical protein